MSPAAWRAPSTSRPANERATGVCRYARGRGNQSRGPEPQRIGRTVTAFRAHRVHYASARDAQSDSGRRSGSQIDRPLAYHTRLRDGGDEELAFRRERSDEDQNIKSVLLRDSRRYGDIRRRRGITFDSSRVRGLQRRRCEADGCGRCSVARERRGDHDATHAERSVGNRGGGLWRHCG